MTTENIDFDRIDKVLRVSQNRSLVWFLFENKYHQCLKILVFDIQYGGSYLAGQSNQIAHHLLGQSRQITYNLAGLSHQIVHYLAEDLVAITPSYEILFSEATKL